MTALRKAWPTDGRALPYLAMTVGVSISVYANVAAKYVRKVETGGHVTWEKVTDPALDGLILAALAPVIVFLMSELLARVKGSGWEAWAVRVVAFVVAAVGFVASYQHLNHLLLARNDSGVTAMLYPFGVDGLMVGAVIVLWQIRHQSATAAAGEAAKGAAPVGEPEPERAQAVDEPAAEPAAAPSARTSRPAKVGARKVDPIEVKRLAREDGLSQREIATRLRVDPKTVSRALRADTPTTPLSVIRTDRTGS